MAEASHVECSTASRHRFSELGWLFQGCIAVGDGEKNLGAQYFEVANVDGSGPQASAKTFLLKSRAILICFFFCNGYRATSLPS